MFYTTSFVRSGPSPAYIRRKNIARDSTSILSIAPCNTILLSLSYSRYISVNMITMLVNSSTSVRIWTAWMLPIFTSSDIIDCAMQQYTTIAIIFKLICFCSSPTAINHCITQVTPLAPWSRQSYQSYYQKNYLYIYYWDMYVGIYIYIYPSNIHAYISQLLYIYIIITRMSSSPLAAEDRAARK